MRTLMKLLSLYWFWRALFRGRLLKWAVNVLIGRFIVRRLWR